MHKKYSVIGVIIVLSGTHMMEGKWKGEGIKKGASKVKEKGKRAWQPISRAGRAAKAGWKAPGGFKAKMGTAKQYGQQRGWGRAAKKEEQAITLPEWQIGGKGAMKKQPWMEVGTHKKQSKTPEKGSFQKMKEKVSEMEGRVKAQREKTEAGLRRQQAIQQEFAALKAQKQQVEQQRQAVKALKEKQLAIRAKQEELEKRLNIPPRKETQKAPLQAELKEGSSKAIPEETKALYEGLSAQEKQKIEEKMRPQSREEYLQSGASPRDPVYIPSQKPSGRVQQLIERGHRKPFYFPSK